MDAAAQIKVIKREIEDAADAFISVADRGLAVVERIRAGEAAAVDALEAIFCSMLEACAFQDLTGQRLDRLAQATFGEASTEGRDPLLNGPADDGQGLGQAAADRLLSGTATGR